MIRPSLSINSPRSLKAFRAPGIFCLQLYHNAIRNLFLASLKTAMDTGFFYIIGFTTSLDRVACEVIFLHGNIFINIHKKYTGHIRNIFDSLKLLDR